MSPKRFWQACSSHNSTICQIRFKKTLSPKRFWQIVVRETICMLHLWARSQAPLWAGQLIIHPSVGSGWTWSWQVPSLGYLKYQNHPVEALFIEQCYSHPIQLLRAVPVGLALLCAVLSVQITSQMSFSFTSPRLKHFQHEISPFVFKDKLDFCKSSPTFEEDSNPLEEGEAVKDYFLNLTDHQNKVMVHLLYILSLLYKLVLSSWSIPCRTGQKLAPKAIVQESLKSSTMSPRSCFLTQRHGRLSTTGVWLNHTVSRWLRQN